MTAARFSLGREPLTARERSILAPDLEGLGADAAVLDGLAATLAVRSRLTSPAMLRMHVGSQLAGAALVVMCRDSGRSLFEHQGLRRAMTLSPAIWYWERTGLGTDGVACPGFVAPGVERAAFVAGAVRWLAGRHAMGSIMDGVEAPIWDVPHVTWPWVGVTTLSPGPTTRADLVAAHRNLGRKVRRFAARGGRIERVTGPMPRGLHEALISGYAIERPPDPPFRELYESMVRSHWAIRSEDLVHLVAYVGEVPVGYHSFLRSGRTLCLLSGVFGRPDVGTHHAYENVLLDSIDLAVDLGCARIEYGPAINEVKTSLLDVEPTAVHFVSRVPGMVAGMRRLLPRTVLAAATGQAPSPGEEPRER